MGKYVWTDSLWIRGTDGSPVVVLFGRSIDNPMDTIKLGMKNFKPYFYVRLDDWLMQHPNENRQDGISCFGDPIVKVTLNSPTQVKRERSLYQHTFEADIPFDMRFVIDKGISYAFDEFGKPTDVSSIISPLIAYYDCEMIAEDTIPNPDNPFCPVASICVANNYNNDVRVFILNPDISKIDITSVQDFYKEKFDKTYNIEVIPCPNERNLFKQFSSYIGELNPDMIAGWNNNKFDDPYVITRSNRIKADVSELSRIPRMLPSIGRWSGRQLVDMMEYFKDWSKPMGTLPSYGLKYVSKKFLDFEYVNYGPIIHQLVKEGRWQEFTEYSCHDVVALKELDEKIGLFKYYEGLRIVAGVKISDLLSRTRLIDTLLMRRGIKPMPTKEYGENDDEDEKTETGKGYQGATVLKPPIGLQKNVGVLDYKSLYPTIIIAENISPDIDNTIPKVIKEMLEARYVLKRKRLAGTATDFEIVSETSLKYNVNAFYGYMGAKFTRMYKKELAAKITAGGRELAFVGKTFADNNGYKTIYGDTDSIFVKGIATPEMGKNLQEQINGVLVKWATDKGISPELAPEIEFEKLYRQILFKPKNKKQPKKISKRTVSADIAKKRYAGHLIWKDGREVDKLDLVGFETERGDQAEITKTAMGVFLKMVVKEDNIDGALKYIRGIYDDIRNGNVPIQDVAIPRAVKKPNTQNQAWVRGMENASKLLRLTFDSGVKPKLLHCVRPVDEICIDDELEKIPETIHIEIDWNLMAEKIIFNKMRPLVESLGMRWDIAVGDQCSLFSFGMTMNKKE